ncbi:hypothetical protein BDZ94DRAFT_1256621 [Collybia nuda]|uniref:Syntaxin N-terminal domain-containing protein n=1 Tax=Collybia nuda TaxID=64659 RepID=A0A9P5Y6I2_9AGAR|nr:hypothetical protein BDZ94DRAFT_1256621 [Collybia nuda]
MQTISPMNSEFDEASTSHFAIGDLQPTTNLQDNTILVLQSSLSLQVFKINTNVQGILKLVDLLGTARDSTGLREALYVHATRKILSRFNKL